MEALEVIVAAILQNRGFWVRNSVRVELEASKRRNTSDPRTELDVVAYSPKRNELWVIECKSFLDSRGVKSRAFLNAGPRAKKRFKLFHDSSHWMNVRERLLRQLDFDVEPGVSPNVHLCLAAAHFAGAGEVQLKDHFEKNQWRLLGPQWLKEGLIEFNGKRYENDVITMTVKLLTRDVAGGV